MSHLNLSFVTIIARNYVPAARVLARSLQKQHPNSRLTVVTIDADLSDAFSDLVNVRTLNVDDIGLPDLNVMAIKYDIVEFCTCVKPFALSNLLAEGGADAIVYLDPDIMVLSPLMEMVTALQNFSIVLTPHILGQVDDEKGPGEVDFLKAGAYNLGFIALRNDATGKALLEWWCERLFDRCLKSTQDGLFVDQRWIDLVPSLFDGVHILREAGYNVAYWNLHDRDLSLEGEEWRTRNRPVRFYHFSGFSPDNPQNLSKYQTRHDVRDYQDLIHLLHLYTEALRQEGHIAYTGAAYRFARLPNGVQVTPPVRLGLRILIERGLACPDPIENSDAFCAMLCQPVLASQRGAVCALEWGLKSFLAQAGKQNLPMPDVETHDAFLQWCRSDQGMALGLSGVVARAGRPSAEERELDLILAVIEEESVLVRFPGLVTDRTVFQRLVYWAKAYGVARGNWTEAGVAGLDALWPQVRRLFNHCVYEPILMQEMKGAERSEADRLESWLVGVFDKVGGSRHAVRLFCAAFAQHPIWFADLALYAAPTGHQWPTIFELYGPNGDAVHLGHQQRRGSMLMGAGLSVTTQFEIWRSQTSGLTAAAKMRARHGLEKAQQWMTPVEAAEARQVVAHPSPTDAHRDRLNLSGHFLAPTGMGEMARTLLSLSSEAGMEVSSITIPTLSDSEAPSPSPFIFGIPLPQAAYSITAVNADTVNRAVDSLPHHYWAERNIGYWLWETNRLPRRFAETAKIFDEIWTASDSVRDAIAATVDVTVKTLPLALDLKAIAKARSNRQAFDIPETSLVFGLVFDFDSGLERKNPLGVIRAFKAAFGDDPNVCLVLKTHGQPPHTYAARRVFEAARQSNIRFISGVLSRADTLALMASMDVYVSMHRFEGFGLTCAEAMALGKPVIATDYSGNCDFMDSDCAMMVPAEILPTTRAYGPYPIGSLWAEPDESAASEMMRRLTCAQERERLGQKGQARVTSQLSPQAVAKQFKRMLAN